MDSGLLHRADCHASGAAQSYAMVAIAALEPFSLCFHCWNRHSAHLFSIGAVVERLHINDDCDTVVVRT
jgi:hypothetical protein